MGLGYFRRAWFATCDITVSSRLLNFSSMCGDRTTSCRFLTKSRRMIEPPDTALKFSQTAGPFAKILETETRVDTKTGRR